MRLIIVALLLVWCSETVAGDSHRYDHLIKKYADVNGLDFHLVKSVIRAESGFDRRIVSPKKAQGLMQLIPATARRFGVTDTFDPDQNIRAGTRYLKWLLNRFDGNVDFALAGYNAGEGRVDQYGGVPPFKETKQYIARIKRFYRSYKGLPKIRTARQSGKAKILDKRGVEQLALALGLVPKKPTVKPVLQKAVFKKSKKRIFLRPSEAYKPLQIAAAKRPSRPLQQASNTSRVHSLTSQLGQNQNSGVTRYRAKLRKEDF